MLIFKFLLGCLSPLFLQWHPLLTIHDQLTTICRIRLLVDFFQKQNKNLPLRGVCLGIVLVSVSAFVIEDRGFESPPGCEVLRVNALQ
jgi:hypothetical protein